MFLQQVGLDQHKVRNVLILVGSILLFAMWNSSLVRRNLVRNPKTLPLLLLSVLTSFQALPSIDYAILAATSVMDTISDKDPSTRTFRDALQRMTTTTMQMCMSKTNVEHTFPRTTGSKVPVTPRSLLKRQRPEINNPSARKRRSKIAEVYPDAAQSDFQSERAPLETRDFENSFLDLDHLLDPESSTRPYEQPNPRSFSFENFIEEPIVRSPCDQPNNLDALSLASVPSTIPFVQMYHMTEAAAQSYEITESPELVDFDSQMPRETASLLHDLEHLAPNSLLADAEADGSSHLEDGQDVLDAFLVGWADPCSPIDC